jgi:hypothetical protein
MSSFPLLQVLLALAVLCFAASVNAAAVIRTTSFSVAGNCSDAVKVYSSDVTAGDCKQAGGGTYKSYAYYCDDSNNYQVYFSDAACANPTQVVQMANTCGFFNQQQVTCVNTTQGPTTPATSPTIGWVSTVSYANATTGKPADTCAAGTGISITYSSTKPGCQVRSLNTTSSNMYCTADGLFQGYATFNDAQCGAAGGTVLRATLRPVGCFNGVQSSCAGLPTFPATIPNQGIYQYSKDDCSDKNPIIILASSNCFESAKFTCAAGNVTGTTFGTVSQFSGSAGQCTTLVSTTTLPGDLSVCSNRQKFTCNYNGGTPASAASVSISMVAMIAAAVVALFASRSL